MTDQGWMVDDGTCGPCLHGLCYRCVKPQESYDELDDRTRLICCCNEGYLVGYVEAGW